jgi:hypothetical protein
MAYSPQKSGTGAGLPVVMSVNTKKNTIIKILEAIPQAADSTLKCAPARRTWPPWDLHQNFRGFKAR